MTNAAVYKYLFEFLVSILWGVYPEEELLDLLMILLQYFEELPYCHDLFLNLS